MIRIMDLTLVSMGLGVVVRSTSTLFVRVHVKLDFTFNFNIFVIGQIRLYSYHDSNFLGLHSLSDTPTPLLCLFLLSLS